MLGELDIGEEYPNRGGILAPKINRGIEKIIIHENFIPKETHGRLLDMSVPYDIALIRVNESIPLFLENNYISSVNPICLPWNATNIPDPTTIDDLKVTGWGKMTRSEGARSINNKNLNLIKAFAKKLQAVTIPGVDIATCRTETRSPYKRIYIDDEIQFCAGKPAFGRGNKGYF